MIIIPAIDLRHGQCVRLYQGQFDQINVYHNDPVAMANAFAEQGSQWLHLVDLDGAKTGAVAQTDLILQIQKCGGLQIQIGGGIRSQTCITELLSNGIARVVIGSLAVSQPAQVKQWLREFGAERIVLALDIRYNAEGIPCVSTAGWQQDSDLSLWQVLDDYQDAGVVHLLCTSIERDGALSGPDLGLYQQCRQKYPDLQLQASGGIASLSDLRALQSIDVAAVIIGKALYEKKFTLSAALQEAGTC